MKRLQNQIIFHLSKSLRKANIGSDPLKNPKVLELRKTIAELEDKSIKFYIEQYPDGSWCAESTNIEGILSGSNDPREVGELLKDAIFTYFQVPPQFCDEGLLKGDNEPVKVRQKVHVSA